MGKCLIPIYVCTPVYVVVVVVCVYIIVCNHMCEILIRAHALYTKH